MQTVSQHHAPANPAPPTIDVGPAQHAALLRWHSRDAIGDVMDSLAAHPRYPCINGSAVALTTQSDRAPRPAA